MSAVFHKAVLDGDATIVKFIVKNGQGIRVNEPNKYGLTALQQACLDGNLALVNFLLECGADLSLVDSEGRTALHFASEQGHSDVVSLLVNSACADVKPKNVHGETAVDVAKNEQVRAMLSQVMLSESFKQKCAMENRWEESGYCFGFKNVPGWRYSISSTSTDSGVSEDSIHSYDNGAMDSRLPSRYNKAQYSIYGCCGSEQSDQCTSELNIRDSKQEEVIRARRVEPYHGTVGKSHSFTSSRHEYGSRLESMAEERHPRSNEHGVYSHPSPYRRQHKSRKDPFRRKTVTFGDSESYTFSPMDEKFVKSYSLTRPIISSSNRHTLPNKWDSSNMADEQAATLTRFGHQQEPNRKEMDKHLVAKPREESSKKETKPKRHILPGFLEKYVR